MLQPPPTPDAITGLVLAGGRGRRLGGRDKGLVEYRGRPLIAWAIDALRPQVGRLLINANRNLDRYAALDIPVVEDRLDDYQGPLAGIASALAVISTPWLVTIPCDGPQPAPELVARLCTALAHQNGDLAVASDGARLQPVHALIPRALAADLDAFLAQGGRKVEDWYRRHRIAVADFADRADSFANLNTADDAAQLGAPTK